jgi:hypothetical protein
VRSLVEGYRGAGPHTARWYGDDETQRNVPRGVYFRRLHVRGETLVRKLVVVR